MLLLGVARSLAKKTVVQRTRFCPRGLRNGIGRRNPVDRESAGGGGGIAGNWREEVNGQPASCFFLLGPTNFFSAALGFLVWPRVFFRFPARSAARGLPKKKLGAAGPRPRMWLRGVFPADGRAAEQHRGALERAGRGQRARERGGVHHVAQSRFDSDPILAGRGELIHHPFQDS